MTVFRVRWWIYQRIDPIYTHNDEQCVIELSIALQCRRRYGHFGSHLAFNDIKGVVTWVMWRT